MYQCLIGGLYYNGAMLCKGPPMIHNQMYEIVHNKIHGTLAFYQGNELMFCTKTYSILKKGQYKFCVCLHDPCDMIGLINPTEAQDTTFQRNEDKLYNLMKNEIQILRHKFDTNAKLLLKHEQKVVSGHEYKQQAKNINEQIEIMEVNVEVNKEKIELLIEEKEDLEKASVDLNSYYKMLKANTNKDKSNL